jgi:beta-1,4-mannosyl-glycoprotein beta-1,4-N-acetylglucosaminyltransferase
MRIIDTFTFFNELDLLEFRLKFLDSHVDHFVIAESNLTHAGAAKPLYFKENEARFQTWRNRITHIVVNQSAAGLEFTSTDTYNPGAASWKLENEQRNALYQAGNLAVDGDIILVGDLDEIPHPAGFRKLAALKEPVVFSLLFHYYYMNCQNVGNERWWNGTIACPASSWRLTSPQELRDKRNDLPRIKRSGWHFSYLGGIEKIKEKISSFAHTEFNRDEYTSEENIMRAMEKGEDIFRRPGVSYEFVPLEFYPPMLRKLMLTYPRFIHPKKSTLPKRIAYATKRFFQ